MKDLDIHSYVYRLFQHVSSTSMCLTELGIRIKIYKQGSQIYGCINKFLYRRECKAAVCTRYNVGNEEGMISCLRVWEIQRRVET